jgi:GNAT superfamily N-acetyltransferase
MIARPTHLRHGSAVDGIATLLGLHRADVSGKGRQMSPVTRVGVTVTFLRMEQPPVMPGPSLGSGFQIVRAQAPSVPFYRYLYNTVGADYLWWLRRTTPDHELAALLRDKAVSIHTLYAKGEPAGFFELDSRAAPDVNLSYFGLMPGAIGHGTGYAFLCAAIDEAWRTGAKAMTVNTCTADHPRALPNYQRAGFSIVRRVREIWTVPDSLNMRIPPGLKL